MKIKKHLDLLGLPVKDKISDFKGVSTSVSFDLFGCIQALVRPKQLDNDGKMQNGWWFDVSRLKVLSKMPKMDVPDFFYEEEESYKKAVSYSKKGPANKPLKY